MPHVEFTRSGSDKTELYFQGWEPDRGLKAAVCLVHGLGEHTGRYAHVAAALNAADFAVLGFDQRGHGKSPGPRGHIPSLNVTMDDVALLLREAAARYAGKPCFLYGHSMGGAWVLNYALRRLAQQRTTAPSVTGVIATSPALRTAAPPPPIKVALGKVMCRLVPAMQMANALDLPGLSRDPVVIAAYTADPLVHDRISARLGVDLLESGAWALAHAAEFPAIPLLLVHGAADRLTSAAATQEFAARVPGECTLKLWEGFYHETHNEPEKAQVLAFLVDWLLEHTGN